MVPPVGAPESGDISPIASSGTVEAVFDFQGFPNPDVPLVGVRFRDGLHNASEFRTLAPSATPKRQIVGPLEPDDFGRPFVRRDVLDLLTVAESDGFRLGGHVPRDIRD